MIELVQPSLNDEFCRDVLVHVPFFEQVMISIGQNINQENFNDQCVWLTGVAKFHPYGDASLQEIKLPLRILENAGQTYTVSNQNRMRDEVLGPEAFSLYLAIVTSNVIAHKANEAGDNETTERMTHYYEDARVAIYDADLDLSDEEKSAISSLIN